MSKTIDTTLLEIILHRHFPFGLVLGRGITDNLDRKMLFGPNEGAFQKRFTYNIRRLCDKINDLRGGMLSDLPPIFPGQLFSMATIWDVFRYLIYQFGQVHNPGIFENSRRHLQQRSGIDTDPTAIAFIGTFPPQALLSESIEGKDIILQAGEAGTNRDIFGAELILLYLANVNPAFRFAARLFDDSPLREKSRYAEIIAGDKEYFAGGPTFKPLGKPLFECLFEPIRTCSDSLDCQLKFIYDNWAEFLPDELLERILLATDILSEERRIRGLGPGSIEILDFIRSTYGADYGINEPARFSQDADWMSNVVMIAKSIHVWLYQLSNKYKRHCRHLSDIPDEELDQLARWGFTGLWLIGIWERSPASQKIKRAMGNPEAMASAYSLYDYTIAADLGGEEAYINLKERAWRRGIRLASDMVPNHTGIYSRWVIEHPDWFIQLPYPPYPNYRFGGMDLSSDERVMIQIEDGYWDRRDAAVVFKRTDKWTGDVRYIYHGNDGTNMPWNDTAQLNFLNPEVREAVINTIIHVARKFPIIRFDAAMTLAKRHYQRLWFPRPGEGGAIPSRAENGLTREQFDAAMPAEFWREVVDRVAAEAPDTLLLAEAFWLMEGYFVRTLGMHRVYNSAFMNMLKMEENSKYRQTVKNVLEFSPEVLKRFVNFMNNPDEETAIAQFGDGDKYYGIAVMMVTMPGLPMFGHGQIEGFREKYGMEYGRAYWDEPINRQMVKLHEQKIFPLMRRRRLFSGSENFAFYDFVTPEGWVDENVFAYSNMVGLEKAIIIYNNSYNSTRGTIKLSTAINKGDADNKFLIRRTLAEAIDIKAEPGYFTIFKDYESGLEYIRENLQIAERGLFAVLRGYQYNAFLDLREVKDDDGSWRRLCDQLGGAGVPDINAALHELRYRAVLEPFCELLKMENLDSPGESEKSALSLCRAKFDAFCKAAADFMGITAERSAAIESAWNEFAVYHELVTGFGDDDNRAEIIPLLETLERLNGQLLPLGLAFFAIEAVENMAGHGEETTVPISISTVTDEWKLTDKLTSALVDRRIGMQESESHGRLLRLLIDHCRTIEGDRNLSGKALIAGLLADRRAHDYLLVNEYDGRLWLNKERLEFLLGMIFLIKIVWYRSGGDSTIIGLRRLVDTAASLIDSARMAGYDIKAYLSLIEKYR